MEQEHFGVTLAAITVNVGHSLPSKQQYPLIIWSIALFGMFITV